MICAEPDVTGAGGERPPAPSRPSGQPQLRIYARDQDTRIRFIADGLPVAVGHLVEQAFFDNDDHAAAVAAACAFYLERLPGGIADAEGWHAVPKGARLTIFLPNLLEAARKRVWSATDIEPPPLAHDPLGPLPEALERRARGPEDGENGTTPGRPWSSQRQARLCYLMGQGFSAKAIAADPEIHSTELAVYKRASRLGLSFAEAPMGQINFRIPRSHLVVIDRAAAAAGQTRNAFMRSWTMRAIAKPDRYGLVMVAS